MKLTTHLPLVSRTRMVELYLHSPTSSWRSADLIKHRENFTFFYVLQSLGFQVRGGRQKILIQKVASIP
jgi:hypothetical protein